MPDITHPKAAKILEAASRMFATSNFADVHLDKVCDQAGTSRVTMYRFFASKEGLYLSVLANAGEKFLSRLRATEVTCAFSSCHDRLRAILQECFRFFSANRFFVQVLDRDEIGLEVLWRVKALIAEGVATEGFRVDSTELAARALLGTMRFQLLFPCQTCEAGKAAELILAMITRPLKGD